jgi:hypothetical protein
MAPRTCTCLDKGETAERTSITLLLVAALGGQKWVGSKPMAAAFDNHRATWALPGLKCCTDESYRACAHRKMALTIEEASKAGQSLGRRRQRGDTAQGGRDAEREREACNWPSGTDLAN